MTGASSALPRRCSLRGSSAITRNSSSCWALHPSISPLLLLLWFTLFGEGDKARVVFTRAGALEHLAGDRLLCL